MIRRIIKIDESKCNGCSACAGACHEGAIEMIDGKARLTREDYCDGLGDCLPSCPTGAISFETREAAEYNEKAVNEAKRKKALPKFPASCPGIGARAFRREARGQKSFSESSELMQWPCQIKLVPPNAPYFENSDLLIAADCTAYAYGSFHSDFMRGKITLIGCPKLDKGDYTEKLTTIIKSNSVKSIQVVRMEVPCCSGMENAARRALIACGKDIPLDVTVVSTDGKILE